MNVLRRLPIIGGILLMLSAMTPLAVFAQTTDPPVVPIPDDGDTDRTFFFMDSDTAIAVGIIGGVILAVVVIVALVSMASHGGGHTYTHA